MKPPVKYGIALVAFVCIAFVGYEYYNSIPQEDPIAGWQMVLPNLDSDVLISNDYRQFISELPAIDKQAALGPFCFTDGTGQHAVRFDVEHDGRAWEYILIYDKADKRIKTIKRFRGRYQS
jgi:hypothetical protein